MAFGFPAGHSFRFEFASSRGQVRESVRYAFSAIGWIHEEEGPDRFVCDISLSGASWGERFIVSLSEGEIEIQSVCRNPLQFFDWGKNRRNVQKFLAYFAAREERELLLASASDPYLTEAKGGTPVTRLFESDLDHSDEPRGASSISESEDRDR